MVGYCALCAVIELFKTENCVVLFHHLLEADFDRNINPNKGENCHDRQRFVKKCDVNKS